jgi:acetyltransferase-like isoleucine patch superfamily enzyme
VIVEDGAAVLGPAWIEDGAHLYQGVRLGDELQCGKVGEGTTIILHGSQIMDGARIARGVKVGPKAMVRPSAHVVEDVKTGWVVSGDPAKLIFILDVEGATI